MTTPTGMQQRLKYNRPSVRRNTRPPKLRSPVGAAFTAANLGAALVLQHCQDCGTVQYPPRELCQHCLADALRWRETSGHGSLLNRIELHHSLWEYFKRRIAQAPWPIASIKLDCKAIVFAHLAAPSFGCESTADIAAGTAVQVFSHSDCSLNSVLIVVSDTTDIGTPGKRHDIASSLGLLEPSYNDKGI